MINFYKQNKYLFIFIAVFILVFTILFIVFYGKYDLFKFPFISEVWGNAADWAMVIITIITAVYLINTFREQKRATDISFNSHRYSILPKLIIDTNEVDVIVQSGLLSVSVLNNEIFNLKVEYFTRDFNLVNSYPAFLSAKQGIIMYTNNLESNIHKTRIQIAKFNFNDSEGNKYSQYLFQDDKYLILEGPIYCS